MSTVDIEPPDVRTELACAALRNQLTEVELARLKALLSEKGVTL